MQCRSIVAIVSTQLRLFILYVCLAVYIPSRTHAYRLHTSCQYNLFETSQPHPSHCWCLLAGSTCAAFRPIDCSCRLSKLINK